MPSGSLLLCVVVAWLPFVCLFAPFRMTFQPGDAWHLSYTSVLYLHARWLYSPAIAIFGPAWLVVASLLQSTLVMLVLRICMQRVTRLVLTAPSLFARIWAQAVARLPDLRAELGSKGTAQARRVAHSPPAEACLPF